MAEKLKPIYNIVARELALGISLEEICQARSLNLATMQRVARGDLFKSEVTRFQAEVDERMLEHAAEDPILQKLKALSYRAVKRLGEEVDCYDPELGATSNSRISASKAILDKAGYGSRPELGNTQQVIILALSEKKLDSVKKFETDKMVLDNVPDCIDGHLMAIA